MELTCTVKCSYINRYSYLNIFPDLQQTLAVLLIKKEKYCVERDNDNLAGHLFSRIRGSPTCTPVPDTTLEEKLIHSQ